MILMQFPEIRERLPDGAEAIGLGPALLHLRRQLLDGHWGHLKRDVHEVCPGKWC